MKLLEGKNNVYTERLTTEAARQLNGAIHCKWQTKIKHIIITLQAEGKLNAISRLFASLVRNEITPRHIHLTKHSILSALHSFGFIYRNVSMGFSYECPPPHTHTHWGTYAAPLATLLSQRNNRTESFCIGGINQFNKINNTDYV
jgi:hypothetical protein